MSEHQIIPCTEQQNLVARLAARGLVTNVPYLLQGEGALDREILKDALQIVVERHGNLRSRFHRSSDGLAYSTDHTQIDIAFEDVSARQDAMSHVGRESVLGCQTPFVLDSPERLRACVYRVSDREHIVSVVFDHLACDGISLGIIGAEWRSLYQSLDAGTPFTVSGNPPQYEQFALWQRNWLAGPAAEAECAGWLTYLAGLSPAGLRNGAAVLGPVAIRHFQLGRNAVQRISRLCIRHKVTPFMGFLSAYIPLLCCLIERRDFVVATVRSNRQRPDASLIVGQFANVIPLRVGLKSVQTCEGYVRDVAESCRNAYARDGLPFSILQSRVCPKLAISSSDLIQLSINYIPFSGTPLVWSSDLRLRQQWGLLDPRPLSAGVLSLFVRQEAFGLGITAIFDPDIVPAAWVEKMPERLDAVITALDAAGVGGSQPDLLAIAAAA